MNIATRAALLTLGLAVAVTACSDTDPIVPDGEAPFAIRAASTGSGSGSLVSAASLRAGEPSAARIPLDGVASITLPIGEVEVRMVRDDEGDDLGDGEWVVAGSIGESIDLLELPADGVELLDSSLPEGDYDALRFWLTDEATITLERAVTVGRVTYDAGTHPLEIPSADQAGVRLHAGFTVDADGEQLTVLFDGEATVRGVVATGSGRLKIAPVLTVRDEDGDRVGELDANDERDDEGADDENEIGFDGVVVSTGGDSFTLDDGTVVRIVADTELSGDIVSLEALADAVADGETVHAEGEGGVAADGEALIAEEVELEAE